MDLTRGSLGIPHEDSDFRSAEVRSTEDPRTNVNSALLLSRRGSSLTMNRAIPTVSKLRVATL